MVLVYKSTPIKLLRVNNIIRSVWGSNQHVKTPFMMNRRGFKRKGVLLRRSRKTEQVSNAVNVARGSLQVVKTFHHIFVTVEKLLELCNSSGSSWMCCS